MDRNIDTMRLRLYFHVVPYVGTWIEMQIRFKDFDKVCVVPYVGTWIEMYIFPAITTGARRRSLRGNVDRNFLQIRR